MARGGRGKFKVFTLLSLIVALFLPPGVIVGAIYAVHYFELWRHAAPAPTAAEQPRIWVPIRRNRSPPAPPGAPASNNASTAAAPANASAAQRRALSCGDRPALVMGFSNGHVGTTTLTSAASWTDGACKKSTVNFFFEQVPADFAKGTKASRADFEAHVDLAHFKTVPHELEFTEWYGGDRSVDDEAALVRRSYEATWAKRRVALVLGHETLYWYAGAIRAERNVAVVRIRRARYETADSWRENYAYEKVRGALERESPGWFWFAPWLNCDRVLLRLPARGKTSEATSCGASADASDLWERTFDSFQRALWFVDEVEARWQVLKRSSPDVAALVELDWGSTDKGSLDRVAAAIADLIGLRPVIPSKHAKKHRAGPAAAQFSESPEARRLDLAYRAAMRLSDTQRDLVAVVHNESDAKWANGTRSRRS